MSTVFLVCALVGGAILVLQLVLGFVSSGHHEIFGVEVHDDHVLHGHAGEAADTLNLLSVRALSAGLAFFGLAGLLVESTGRGVWLALLAALLAGLAASFGVAAAMRQMLRLESDGSLRMERAVGLPATVYLSIPAARAGAGKVHLTLQGRTVECQAVSDTPLATGASVIVLDVVGPDTVEVAPTPHLGGLLDADR